MAQGVGLVFQGYIYPPNVRYAVERDTSTDQVEILAERLKVRKSPNGDWVEGIFAPLGIYNILGVQTAGEYTWAKLDNECWIALNDKDGWTRTYLKESDKPQEDDYKAKYEELEKVCNDLKNDNKALENDYKALSVENIELTKKIKQLTTELELVKNDNAVLSDIIKKIKEIVE